MSTKKYRKNNINKDSICSKCNNTYLFELTKTTYFGINKFNQFSSNLLCYKSPIELTNYTEIIKDKKDNSIISLLNEQRLKEYPNEILYIQRTEQNLRQFVCAQSFIYLNNLNFVDYCDKKKRNIKLDYTIWGKFLYGTF